MNVRQLLQAMGPRELIKIGPSASVLDAAKLTQTKDIGALLVMEGENLLGIVSERDFVRRVMILGKDPGSTLVSQIMTTNPDVVTLFADIEDCEALMKTLHVRHLPVVDGNKVIGIVSMRDIIAMSRQERTLLVQNYEDYIRGRTS